MASDTSRIEAVAQYREWLKTKLREAGSPQRAEIVRLAGLVLAGEDVVLLCWCFPKLCHGQTIIEAVQRLCTRMS